MKNPPRVLLMFTAFLALSLAACATGGSHEGGQVHLSPTQCADLTALRHNAPTSRERNQSELAALEQAGYHPSLGFDLYYPADLEEAQHKVDHWYRMECPQARPD